MSLKFGVLGPLHVEGCAGGGITAPLQKLLTGLLLCRPNQAVPVDTLMDQLWPSTPDATAQRLQLHVHRLRKSLGEPTRVAYAHGGYKLTVHPGELDAERFESLHSVGTQAVRSGETRRGLALLREAVDLWRGEPYADLGESVPLMAEAARLTELRLSAIEELHASEIAAGVLPVAQLQDLVQRHPMRERPYALLVIALWRSNRRAEALAAYRAARDQLVNELGIEPGDELRRIEAAILAGATPSLRSTAPTSAQLIKPAQLPPTPSPFVSREQELRALDQLLTEPAALAVVSGTAGVGKTALALRWAHRVRNRFPDGQLYVDLRGFSAGSPVPPGDVLGWFLRGLGVAADGIPADVAERAALYRSTVADRQILIVLDNAADAAQVRSLIPGGSGVRVVVTSRRGLRGLATTREVLRVSLDSLSATDSRHLLRAAMGRDRDAVDEAAIAELARLCAGLPLALRIVAANLADTARPMSLYVDELRDSRRLVSLSVVGDEDIAVRASFEVSYRQLGPVESRLFQLLGLHPGVNFESGVASALLTCEPSEAGPILERLADVGLLVRAAAGRYAFHDLLRAYAAELACTLPTSEAASTIERALDWYLHTAAAAEKQLYRTARTMERLDPPAVGVVPADISGYDEALAWFDDEWANLTAGVQAAKTGPFPDRGWQIAATLYSYIETRLRWQNHEELYDVAIAAARATGRRDGLALMLHELGSTHVLAGRFAEAATSYTASLELCRELPDARGEAAALGNIAYVMHSQGKVEEAIPHYRALLRLDPDIVGDRGSDLNNLADALLRLGKAADALSSAEKRSTITRATASNSAGRMHLGISGKRISCWANTRPPSPVSPNAWR